MPFDVEKLYEFCSKEIKTFIDEHKNETFYAFAIDANLLCLNSEEKFKETLKYYQTNWDRKTQIFSSWSELTEQDLKDISRLLDIAEKYNKLDRSDTSECLKLINSSRQELINSGGSYYDDNNIIELKKNTGDWEYQGFVELSEYVGFDHELYNIHYDLDEDEQKSSEYGLAMDALITKLKSSDTFSNLKKTSDFYIKRVEHNY